jgi:hypothetical protein
MKIYFEGTHKSLPWVISFIGSLFGIEALAVSNQDIDVELLHIGRLPTYICR